MINLKNDAPTEVLCEAPGCVGLITLSRPGSLNALTLPMVRKLMHTLLTWQRAPGILAVAIRGDGKEGPFGVFCAGGDIRFLHKAASSGDPQIDDFFTEEYALNFLIHTYSKPIIAFMDGVVMGGGMGIGQGASLRIVTDRTRMAMPETAIGLFPDVGAGYFLSRCPGRVGEWLALTGATIDADTAIAAKLADCKLPANALHVLWQTLATTESLQAHDIEALISDKCIASNACGVSDRKQIDHYFSLDSVCDILLALEASEEPWEKSVASQLRSRSPLMLYVALEQIRRARSMSLADDLRMERGMMRHCFGLRLDHNEALEGIRAMAVDKDHAPKWSPSRVEDVTSKMMDAFFENPWALCPHPLASLT